MEKLIGKLEDIAKTFLGMAQEAREKDPSLSYSAFVVCDTCRQAAKALREIHPGETAPEWEGDSGNGYWKVCGECHERIREKWKYCPHCGCLINWHGWE